MRLLAQLIHTAIGVYSLGLVLYVVLSWANAPQVTAFRLWLGRYYVPVLGQISKRIKPITLNPGTTIDLSPVILFIALYLLKGIVVSMLVPHI